MPGKLVLVGSGLSAGLITLRGVREISDADLVYVDSYTSVSLGGSAELIKSLTGRDLVPLKRGDVEERYFEILLRPALEGLKVVVVVPGNPLDATTHAALLVEAGKRGVDFDVVPAPGIIPNALTMSGLMLYKMGKVVTITYPRSGAVSEYAYDVLKDNDSRNLHTPFLTEMDLEKGLVMQVREAVEILYMVEATRGEGVVRDSRMAIAVSGLTGESQRICFKTLGELRGLPDHGGPHTLIVTSPKMHFMEEEAARIISGKYCR
ncbi:MAG: diphthine synthase [Zestosphaera sp.]